MLTLIEKLLYWLFKKRMNHWSEYQKLIKENRYIREAAEDKDIKIESLEAKLKAERYLIETLRFQLKTNKLKTYHERWGFTVHWLTLIGVGWIIIKDFI